MLRGKRSRIEFGWKYSLLIAALEYIAALLLLTTGNLSAAIVIALAAALNLFMGYRSWVQQDVQSTKEETSLQSGDAKEK